LYLSIRIIGILPTLRNKGKISGHILARGHFLFFFKPHGSIVQFFLFYILSCLLIYQNNINQKKKKKKKKNLTSDHIRFQLFTPKVLFIEADLIITDRL
jgi:hypothetical protein